MVSNDKKCPKCKSEDTSMTNFGENILMCCNECNHMFGLEN